jgi:hypothetical protein
MHEAFAAPYTRAMPRRGRARHLPKVTLKYIHRIEFSGWGWRVLVNRAPHQEWRFFADGADGPFESLRSAIAWRDETWRRLGPAAHARRRGSRPSTTGIVGVSHEVTRQDGRVYEKYRAAWLDADGHPRKRTFSIDRFGEAEARRRAARARRDGVAEADRARRERLADLLHGHRQVVRASDEAV